MTDHLDDRAAVAIRDRLRDGPPSDLGPVDVPSVVAAWRERRRRRRMGAGLVVAIAALVVGTTLAVGDDPPAGPEVVDRAPAPAPVLVVPDVTGLLLHDARTAIVEAGFTRAPVVEGAPDRQDALPVVDQSPAPGARLAADGAVHLVVPPPGGIQGTLPSRLVIANATTEPIWIVFANGSRAQVDPATSVTLGSERVCSLMPLRATTLGGRAIATYDEPCDGQTWTITDDVGATGRP